MSRQPKGSASTGARTTKAAHDRRKAPTNTNASVAKEREEKRAVLGLADRNDDSDYLRVGLGMLKHKSASNGSVARQLIRGFPAKLVAPKLATILPSAHFDRKAWSDLVEELLARPEKEWAAVLDHIATILEAKNDPWTFDHLIEAIRTRDD